MDYVIEIYIADNVDEVSQQRIKKILNDGTLRVDCYPKAGMPILLEPGLIIQIRDVLPLRKYNFNASAKVLVSILPPARYDWTK